MTYCAVRYGTQVLCHCRQRLSPKVLQLLLFILSFEDISLSSPPFGSVGPCFTLKMEATPATCIRQYVAETQDRIYIQSAWFFPPSSHYSCILGPNAANLTVMCANTLPTEHLNCMFTGP
jgi:hypothetical protein